MATIETLREALQVAIRAEASAYASGNVRLIGPATLAREKAREALRLARR